MKTLVYLAHPRMDRSEVNGKMFEAARSIDGITCVDLYADYPTFEIDIDAEQKRLVDHDAIVLQHPLYWYSSPAILKEWQDLVLEHGFAYGHHGRALEGKVVLNAVTCGAAETSYTPQGENGAYLRDLLAPFEKTFDLCRMQYLAPFALFGAGRALEEGRESCNVVAYATMLTALRDDRVDLGKAHEARTLNTLIAPLVPQVETV